MHYVQEYMKNTPDLDGMTKQILQYKKACMSSPPVSPPVKKFTEVHILTVNFEISRVENWLACGSNILLSYISTKKQPDCWHLGMPSLFSAPPHRIVSLHQSGFQLQYELVTLSPPPSSPSALHRDGSLPCCALT